MEMNEPFPEWRALALLTRHAFGCTKFEIVHFLGLSPELAATALARLQASGAVAAEPYVRGAVFSRSN
jgi:hypothetical protein